MNPTLSMMLARLRVSELLRDAERRRMAPRPRASRRQWARWAGWAGWAGRHYHLSDGSWIHGRHDSA
jgi:hypothetical protein